jgi:hypothetical protein
MIMENEKIYGLGKKHEAVLTVLDPMDGRGHVKGALVSKDGFITACDTRVLLRLPLNEYDAGDYPTDERMTVPQMQDDNIWFSFESISRGIKSIAKNVSINVLGNAFPIQNGKVSLITNDLSNKSEVTEDADASKGFANDYPDVKKVIALKKEDAVLSLTLSLDVLGKVVDSLRKAKKGDRDTTVDFIFQSETRPVRFVANMENYGGFKKIIGCFMPHKKNETAVDEYIQEVEKIKDKTT